MKNKDTLPDSGLIDFGIRRYDLSGDPTGENPADWHVPAYGPLRPGLWLGYAPGASVRARHGALADGPDGLILSLEPGTSPWMSLEMELDADGLARSGAALITLEAAASPLASVRLVLRLPCRDMPSGFWDTPSESIVLDASIARKSRVFFPQVEMADFAPHDGFPSPVLIAFLPLRRTDLFLSAVSVGPTP